MFGCRLDLLLSNLAQRQKESKFVLTIKTMRQMSSEFPTLRFGNVAIYIVEDEIAN
jgi:hypothetical protein